MPSWRIGMRRDWQVLSQGMGVLFWPRSNDSTTNPSADRLTLDKIDEQSVSLVFNLIVQAKPLSKGSILRVTEHGKSTAWIIYQIKAKTLRIQNIGDDTPTIGVLLWLFGLFPWQPWPLSFVNLQYSIKVCYDRCSKLLKSSGFFYSDVFIKCGRNNKRQL